MYFPPLDSNDRETVTPGQLQWKEDKIAALYDYLDSKKTKGFMVLKNGRIVMEKYFNGHDQNAKWTWYSAATSLTATFVGVAQAEGHININNKTSDYLGGKLEPIDYGTTRFDYGKTPLEHVYRLDRQGRKPYLMDLHLTHLYDIHRRCR